MTHEEIVAMCESVLNAKGKEYASPEDRWHNFHSAAEHRKLFDGMNYLFHAEHWACAFAMKHYISCLDIANGKPATPEIVKEKGGDLVNYYLIWRCIRAGVTVPETDKWLKEIDKPWAIGYELLSGLK